MSFTRSGKYSKPHSYTILVLKIVCAVALVLSMIFGGAAFGEQTKSNALTIYSKSAPGAISPELYRPSGNRGRHGSIPGYAVVKQEREIILPEKRNEVKFTDVAALIDPTTVSFTSLTEPAGTSVLEQNFQFDLVSQNKLLERYLDREITVEQIQGSVVESFTGTLLSAAGGLTLRSADGTVRIMNNYSSVRFPELPGGLITKPTLLWDVVTEKPGTHKTRVTYQTGGITWWADYNIVFAEGEDANSGFLDIGAWVSIINKSGASYRDAKLKLVAGDVHRAPPPVRAPPRGDMALESRVRKAADGFKEKAFFEYHMYTLGRRTTLPDNSTKQIELFPMAHKVPAEKMMLYYGTPEYRSYYSRPMTDRRFGTISNKKIDIYLKFKNEKENGMGVPLPSGRIRVSKLDTDDGSLEFIGEDVIDHTPKDEEVLIKLGSAFDVVGERKQVDFKIDTVRKWMEEKIEVRIRNHKEEPVTVIVMENLYRWVNWEITQSDEKYEKIDSRIVHFPLKVDRDGEKVLRYTVRYSW